ncbi:hypothetical protein [Streptomyces shaanxiensis]|uniref:Uncharacterized protein n=1 Tax=Streptomyces shaanxiensis TaxID=653357 RepID=A0ABP7V3Y9_9ACTN
MRGTLVQVGEQLLVDCPMAGLSRLLSQACPDAWRSPAADFTADVEVVVQPDSTPFAGRGWEPLSRGAIRRDGAVVLRNACASGFDLRIRPEPDRLLVEARWRPPTQERLAALVLRPRFHLLARAALVQYPALWWAGCHGRVPLHAAALTVGNTVALLAGPGGIGTSTLLFGAVTAGEHACADNLVACGGRDVYGLVEPVRVAGSGGRRMAHGRVERPLPGRVEMLRPATLVVLRRNSGARPVVRPLDPQQAAQSLAAGTYMAGELRRYWSFAATLALGTGRGPVHPPVTEVAHTIARHVPACELVLGDRPSEGLAELLRLGAPDPQQDPQEATP